MGRAVLNRPNVGNVVLLCFMWLGFCCVQYMQCGIVVGSS